MNKPKLFFYKSFGETISFAEDLGWEDDAIEEEAIAYIKGKGYLIVDEWEEYPDPEVLKALKNADSETVKQVEDWYREVGSPNTISKVYLDAVQSKQG